MLETVDEDFEYILKNHLDWLENIKLIDVVKKLKEFVQEEKGL